MTEEQITETKQCIRAAVWSYADRMLDAGVDYRVLSDGLKEVVAEIEDVLEAASRSLMN